MIKAKGNLLLSQKGKPISSNDPIWQEEAIAPAAFFVNQQTPPQLILTVHTSRGRKWEEYYLEGYLDLDNEIVLFSGNATDSQNDSNNIDFVVSAQNVPEQPTHISGKQIYWRITPSSTGKAIALNNLDIDLYWLIDADEMLFLRGIPVEILRAAEPFQICVTIQG